MTDNLPSGTLIAGRYELGELLGEGGAGRVYSAVDQRLHRRVAIKLVSADRAHTTDPASTARFVDEARTGARFTHPHAVTVFDAGSSDDYLYLVTELVEGTNLAAHIDSQGALPIDRALTIADQILTALAAAHAAGFVHRDVKPSNVLIDTDGNAKLADFGIAKRLDDVQSSLTADGHFVGTPRYAAPEQAAGQAATAASDVYATGVVLYEMLTGAAPYDGDSPVAVALAHQTAPIPDVRAVRADVPTAVADVVQRSLAKSPGDRYPQAAAMRDALSAARHPITPAASGTQVYPVEAMAATAVQRNDGPTASDRLKQMSDDDDGPTRKARWIWAGLAALVVVAIGAALLADRDGEGSADRRRSGATTVPAAAATTPASSLAPTTTAAATTAPSTTPPTTEPSTTTAPPTTSPPTEPALTVPIDLTSLITFVQQSSDMGEKQSDLLVELEKVAEHTGSKQREEAFKTAEKASEWWEKGELDVELTTYAIDILNEISAPGGGHGNNGGGDSDGDDD